MREGLWPHVAVQPRLTGPGTDRYVRSYLVMRVLVGALGIALPLLLVLGEPLFSTASRSPEARSARTTTRGPASCSWARSCAIGVFLVTYKVAERSGENWLSFFAGVAVTVVALFPTGRPGIGVTPTPLQNLIGETTVERIHFTAAAVFIGSLAVISYYFAKPPPGSGRRSPSFWHRYHLTCAGFIVAALLLAAVAGFTGWPDKGLLIAEAVAIWAFGASWFMKGLEIDTLLGRHEADVSAPQASAEGTRVVR